jgi:hypothetical protein
MQLGHVSARSVCASKSATGVIIDGSRCGNWTCKINDGSVGKGRGCNIAFSWDKLKIMATARDAHERVALELSSWSTQTRAPQPPRTIDELSSREKARDCDDCADCDTREKYRLESRARSSRTHAHDAARDEYESHRGRAVRRVCPLHSTAYPRASDGGCAGNDTQRERKRYDCGCAGHDMQREREHTTTWLLVANVDDATSKQNKRKGKWK